MSDTPRTDAVDAQNKEVHSAFYEMRSHAWQLERELTEAREDCEVTSRIAEEMTKQRDLLAEALEIIAGNESCGDNLHGNSDIAKEALAATTKDPHRFCRTTSHCGCRYNS
jgi:hypothetical protein